MKQRFIELWVKPVIEHPRTTLAGVAGVAALFLPHHATEFTAAATALGLMFSADAGKQ